MLELKLPSQQDLRRIHHHHLTLGYLISASFSFDFTQDLRSGVPYFMSRLHCFWSRKLVALEKIENQDFKPKYLASLS